MTPDEQPRARKGSATRRPAVHDLVPAAGALLYVVLGLLPWAAVTLDVLGRISASGYGFSVLVPIGAVLLVAAGAWALLTAVVAVPVPFPRSGVTLGLAAPAFLLTLVTWLRSTDYGFEPVPLLALLVTVAVAVSAARALLPELRAAAGAGRPDPVAHDPVPGDPPAAGG
ncbi:hypothetical protein [Modestobacter lapidis]|nr:hypothetical protein [Modestobacter lapidis]